MIDIRLSFSTFQILIAKEHVMHIDMYVSTYDGSPTVAPILSTALHETGEHERRSHVNVHF